MLVPAAQASLLRAAAPPSRLPDDLTPREADVLRAIAAGTTKAEIASQPYISGVSYAYDHGLVTPRS